MTYMSFDEALEWLVRSRNAKEAFSVWKTFEAAMEDQEPEAREAMLTMLSGCWCGPGRGSCGFSAVYSLVDGVLTIAGRGAVDHSASHGNSVFACRDDIRHVVIGEGITCIGHGAFEGCSMETLVLPESLEEICDGAFAECERLQQVKLQRHETKIAPNAFPETCRLEYAE